jgi:hypothetical protein
MALAACMLIVTGASWAERRWKNLHPPDDWDGMREDKDDEHS